MYTDSITTGVSTLQQRQSIAVGAMYAIMAVFSLTAVGEVLELVGAIDLAFAPDEPLATAYQLLLVINSIIFIGSVIVVAMWIHRAHANLQDAGVQFLEFTPGWAVGWYFVPIATYFKPFQAMRELWRQSYLADGSFTTETPPLLKTWWGLWVTSILLSNISSRLLTSDDGSTGPAAITLSFVSSLCIIGAAWMLIQIMRQITAAQVDGIVAAQIFE